MVPLHSDRHKAIIFNQSIGKKRRAHAIDAAHSRTSILVCNGDLRNIEVYGSVY
jgi:hypothetical protein